MSLIALIAMSGKPYHAGHAGLVGLASDECDEVHLYVSTRDRAKKGETPVLGSDMVMLWKATIEQSLPWNVKVTYSEGSPISDVWDVLGRADKVRSGDAYVIYSDPTDLSKNFPPERLKKYCEYLCSRAQIQTRPIGRSQTVQVSGTQMRGFLATGDKESFVRLLSKGVDAELVWNTLRKHINPGHLSNG